jgi:hypothetical protein
LQEGWEEGAGEGEEREREMERESVRARARAKEWQGTRDVKRRQDIYIYIFLCILPPHHTPVWGGGHQSEPWKQITSLMNCVLKVMLQAW